MTIKFLRYLLKGVILYIHFLTRTPLIILFYSVMFFGIFGKQSKVSFLCFTLFLITIFFNLLLVLIFNTPLTKKKAIDLVGFQFHEKYLSHSTIAAKSLTRLLAPTSIAYVYDLGTGVLRNNAHRESTEQLLNLAESQYQAGNRRMGDQLTRTVSNLNNNYVYGGSITEGVRQMRNHEVTRGAMDSTVRIVERVIGRRD